MLKVQSSFVVNEIDFSPVALVKDNPLVMMSASMVISDFISSGLGSGVGSTGVSISPHPGNPNDIANNAIPNNWGVFINSFI